MLAVVLMVARKIVALEDRVRIPTVTPMGLSSKWKGYKTFNLEMPDRTRSALPKIKGDAIKDSGFYRLAVNQVPMGKAFDSTHLPPKGRLTEWKGASLLNCGLPKGSNGSTPLSSANLILDEVAEWSSIRLQL